MKMLMRPTFTTLFFPSILLLAGCSHYFNKLISAQNSALSIVQEVLEPDQPLSAEVLHGGNSGASLIKVTSPDSTYVVRFLDKQFCQYHQQEITSQRIAAEAGYGPKFYFGDAEQGVIVMEYLAPEPFPADENRLSSIVQLVHKIHSGPEFPVTLSTYELIEDSIKVLAEQDQNFVDLKELQEIVDASRKAMANFPHLAPCHRDLNPGNLVYAQGQFFAIDYMSASQDDPYIDLATVALFNCFTPDAERSLLTMYLGHEASQKELAKLSLMKSVVYINIATILLQGLKFSEYVPEDFIKEVDGKKLPSRTYLQMLQ